MKVLVIGQCDVSFLLENTTYGFLENGHNAEYFNIKLHRKIDKYIYSKFTQNTLHVKLKNFKPDLIFLVAPLYINTMLYEVIESYKTNYKCFVAGWIGDIFNPKDNENIQKLSIMDKVFITDSGFQLFF